MLLTNEFESSMGLEPIYSTTDPDGNPATVGEEAARILRNNFTKIESANAAKADSVNNLGSEVVYAPNGQVLASKKGQDEDKAPTLKLFTDDINEISDVVLESITYNDMVDLNIAVTTGNSANMRAYYNLDPVRDDGVLDKFRVVMKTAGELNVQVLRPGVETGIYASEVNRFKVNVVIGYNEFDLKSLGIETKIGDFLSLSNTSSVRIAFVTSTTSVNVIPRGQSDVYASVTDPVKVTSKNSSNLLYFLYQFDVVSKKPYGKTVQNYGSLNATPVDALNGWVSIGEEFLRDGIITRFMADIVTAGTYNFCTGIIDQRNWIIPSEEFSLNLIAGNNVQTTKLRAKQGDRLFMQVNNGIHFDATKGSMFFTPDIESEVSEITGIYPVSIDLTYYDSPFATKEEVQDIRQAVANIVIPDNTIIPSEDGTKWKLIISNEGVVSTKRIDVKNWLVIHNSIGKSPITDIWWGAWGMAASERAKDFIHLLTDSIRQRYPNLNDPVLIGSGSTSWERTHNQDYDYETKLAPYLSTDTDLVILRLGENVVDYTNYEANYGTYLDKIREFAPNAQIIATGVFWNNPTTDNAQRNAALSRGIPFVELSDLDKPEYKSFIGDVVWGDDGFQHSIDNVGVSRHPNDAGQNEIYIRIDARVA
ncbi:hypothetical protein [Dysgonomonas gadei]|uniref:hypothetical protein n=1 Tax=Dysgonomonas gadei TaxID=156974 RepID=UPI003AF1255C